MWVKMVKDWCNYRVPVVAEVSDTTGKLLLDRGFAVAAEEPNREVKRPPIAIHFPEPMEFDANGNLVGRMDRMMQEFDARKKADGEPDNHSASPAVARAGRARRQ